MKWVYMILILVCFGVAIYDITINSPYYVLWAMNSIICTIFFVGEFIYDKIDRLYEKISNNSK